MSNYPPQELARMCFTGEAQFAELSDKGRETVRRRCAAMDRILKTEKSRGHAVQREALNLGLCGSAVRRLLTAYKRSNGHWTSMIKLSEEPHLDQRLPAEFVEFWKSLCEENQRKNKPAWKVLRRLYQTRATTYTSPKGQTWTLWPGYAERPAMSPSSKDDLPRGWSYANLSLHAPTKAELTDSRVGPLAAAEFEEMILTGRKGMRPGQHYIPDDCWPDVSITVSPTLSRFPVRMAELGCGDLASAKKIAWGLTPQIKDDEGHRNYLKKRDMRYLMAKIMCRIGFHKDGVTFWVEHGTAGIWPELEELLIGLCASIGVPFRVKRSGIKGGKAFGGGYETLGKGNFRLKAAYESNHNLCHNERANLPGQTGSNSRLNFVEDQVGRSREATEVLTASLQLVEKFRPGAINGLKTGYLTFSDYFWCHDTVEQQIGDYHDHELQGWEEAGFMISEYRMAADGHAPWQPMETLLRYTPEQRAAFDVMFQTVPNLTRTRRMSRTEAWLSGQADLVRLPLHCVPEILGPEFANDLTVGEDGMFAFYNQDCGEDQLIARGKAVNARGQVEILRIGQTYRTWVNPFDQRLLFVSTVEGKYVGTCEIKTRLERGDDDAFSREIVRVRTEHAERMAPHLARQRKQNAQVTRDRKHNLEVEAQATAPNSTIEDYELPAYGEMNNSQE